MKNTNILFASIATFCFATAASAQETNTDWSGFYTGVTYGSKVGGDMTYTPGSAYGSLESGSSYGLYAGYNIQRNKIVYGGEISYSDAAGHGPAGFPAEEFNYFMDLKARAGMAVDKTLFYGFVGYSDGEFEFADGRKHNVSGTNYGIGMDVKLGERFFVGAEYIVRDLSGTSNPGQTQDTMIQAVQLRTGWKF